MRFPKQNLIRENRDTLLDKRIMYSHTSPNRSTYNKRYKVYNSHGATSNICLSHEITKFPEVNDWRGFNFFQYKSFPACPCPLGISSRAARKPYFQESTSIEEKVSQKIFLLNDSSAYQASKNII